MADQFNENNPAVGNQIANDIPDIKESLHFLVDVIQNFCGGAGGTVWSNTDASIIWPKALWDDDEDTGIQVEESADEDYLRFDTGGTERLLIGTNVQVAAASILKVDTIQNRTADNGVDIEGLNITDAVITTAECIDSDQYIDGSIDADHLASNSVTNAKLANNAVDTAELAADAVTTVKITDANVTQAKLKTDTEEESTNSSSPAKLTFSDVGAYGFYPQVKGPGSGTQTINISNVQLTASYATVITMSTTAGTVYARIRYVSSSGEVWWMFFLVDKNTKKTISARSGQEHPCYGNGGKPMVLPHPFGDYDPQKHEIYVCNPSEELLNEIKSRVPSGSENIGDRSILQVVNEDYDLDFKSNPPWPKIPITVGFKKEPELLSPGETVEVMKKVIPQPDYIKTVGLKLRK